MLCDKIERREHVGIRRQWWYKLGSISSVILLNPTSNRRSGGKKAWHIPSFPVISYAHGGIPKEPLQSAWPTQAPHPLEIDLSRVFVKQSGESPTGGQGWVGETALKVLRLPAGSASSQREGWRKWKPRPLGLSPEYPGLSLSHRLHQVPRIQQERLLGPVLTNNNWQGAVKVWEAWGCQVVTLSIPQLHTG